MRVVLIGTGTGIGKTHVACALLEAWSERGLEGVGLKPVETGVTPDEAPVSDRGPAGMARAPRERDRAHLGGVVDEPSDQCRLWQSSRLFHVKRGLPSTFHVKRSLYSLTDPVSPHLAARTSGVAIDLGAIQAWTAEHAAPRVVVETAGGLFSPLSHHTTNLDLVQRLMPAIVVLVAPDRLGVLHDLTATIGFAEARGLSIRGVALSAPAQPDPSTHRNAAEIDRLGLAQPIATFPRLPLGADGTRAAAIAVLNWIERTHESLL